MISGITIARWPAIAGLLLAIGLPFETLIAAPPSPPPPAPALVCDQPQFEFGVRPNTETVTNTFVLRNQSDKKIFITKVQQDCGCMELKIHDVNLAPGDQTRLDMKFPLKGRHGIQRRRIFIESTDRIQPRLILSLIGEAVTDVQIAPERIFWGNLATNAAAEKVVEIKFGVGDYAINTVSSSNVMFTVQKERVEKDRLYRLRIRSVPPLPLGSFNCQLTIATDHPRYPVVSVPMYGRIVSTIFSVPEEIQIPEGTNVPISRVIMVQSAERKSFNVSGVDPAHTGIKVRMRAAFGGGWRIELENLPPPPELAGKHLRIFTDNEFQKELLVPFRVVSPADIKASGTKFP